MNKNALAIWNRFVDTGEIAEQVNPLIRRSWQRCLEYNVEHGIVDRTQILSGDLLKTRLETNQDLVDVATPVMKQLFGVLEGIGCSVVLADVEGYILKAFANNDFRKLADRVTLLEGANWSESTKGTNAIGTSLAEGVPVNVITFEHFVKENHLIACAAVPIFSAGREILGTIDVTCDGRKRNDRIYPMVSMAASNIEKELHLLALQKKYSLYRAKYEGILELMRDGAVVVGEDGTIIEINQTAGAILGIKPQECLGVNIQEIFNFNNMWVLDNRVRDTREVTVSTKHGATLVNARTKTICEPNGSLEGIITVVSTAGAKDGSRETGSDLPGNVTPANKVRYTFDHIIGQSEYLKQVISICKRVARTNSTVLLNGETGTGKEMLAQAIHQESTRSNGPFVAVNCGAISPELIESELFGYEEGAFTGARKGGQPGKFEFAHGGTIFLDEIGDMPLKAQVSLLRVLQEKQFCRVGGRQTKQVDVRVIAATHRNLAEMVGTGVFRQDLYYRLNVVHVNIPPLRARKNDIELLTAFFLDKYKAAMNRPNLQIAPEAMGKFMLYYWPGNIRELENVVEGLVNIVAGDVINPEDLPRNITGEQCEDGLGPVVTMRDIEKDAIKQAIVDCQGGLTEAAQRLGIGRSTLYRKLKEYNIDAKSLIN